MNMSLVQFIGIPYAVKGEPPTACDCWTLIRYYYAQAFGIELPQYLYNPETISEDSAEQIRVETGRALGERWILVDELRAGDVLIMTMAGVAQHCGVYVGGGDFLHSLPGRDSTIERVALWKNHIVDAYRWRL